MFDVERQIEQWRAGLVGSEMLGNSTVDELESHLREEMGDLKASGLSDEEAFFVSRRRLGEVDVLAAEFAKVNPARRFAGRFLWMAIGVLGYFLVFHLSACATYPSALLGYAIGLRNPYLGLLVCLTYVAAFAGIVTLMWRYLAGRSSSGTTRRGASKAVWVGLFAACVAVALHWMEVFGNPVMARMITPQGLRQVLMAQASVSLCWATLAPFLVAGLIAFLAPRDQRRARSRGHDRHSLGLDPR